ncbi:MAG: hypothetical protein HYX24_01635 [Candidatus Aenigmarchaeota archaeon]|nr:hypothetical protein [Candidatus Aenigmarchaeota archaeon]
MSNKIVIVVFLSIILATSGIYIVQRFYEGEQKGASDPEFGMLILEGINEKALDTIPSLVPKEFPGRTYEQVAIASQKINETLLKNPAYDFEVYQLPTGSQAAKGQLLNSTRELLRLPKGRYEVYAEHKASGTIIKLDAKGHGYVLSPGSELIVPVPQELKRRMQDTIIKREVMASTAQNKSKSCELLITFINSTTISQKYHIQESINVRIVGRTLWTSSRYLLLPPSCDAHSDELVDQLKSYSFVQWVDID